MGKGKKILIVEDEYYLAEVLKERLEYWGYEVELAENGKTALDYLLRGNADLILMDVIMPVMDGWEAARRIKSDSKLKKIPLVFLTARARHEDHLKAHRVGGEDYLAKPFEMEELKEILEKWIV